jgi:molybdopterin-guanine dinucleotide biosynthesis protein MobB
MNHKNTPETPHYIFNPLEFSVCGFSGTGKTTLLESLAAEWQRSNKHFAYVKHDAHRLSLDQPGKDSYRLSQAGAAAVYISSTELNAFIACSSSPSIFVSQALLDYDFVLIEGYKHLPLPKLVMLDAELRILDEISQEHYSFIRGFCGPWPSAPEQVKKFSPAPYFCRNAIDAIRLFIEGCFAASLATRPLHGLLLAGGRSERMGQDKALLSYHGGKTQLEHSSALLAEVCSKVYISCGDQPRELPSTATALLSDRFLALGPLGGILSALQQDPRAAWLVLAIDMPALTAAGLQLLLQHRDPYRYATAFRASWGAAVEPLCAIYEAKCFPALLAQLSRGQRCPSRMLTHLRIAEVDAASLGNELQNINNPHERTSFLTNTGTKDLLGVPTLH